MPTKGPKSETFSAFYDCVDVMLSGVFHTVEAAVPKVIERGQAVASITRCALSD